jgi:ATP-dependent helicase HrpB
LLDAGLANNKEILVLEPRRIAARAAAEFIARERGGTVGGEVGYRVRFEQRGGTTTRLWFLTEGVLARQLTSDPFLERAAIIVLDEFHERHLQGDVALAVIRELQETVRPDLKLVVMSATLEAESLAAALGDCRVLISEGRSYAVDIEYADTTEAPLAARVASALRHVLQATDRGDVLVFLPGAADIRRAAAAVEPLAEMYDLEVITLHGDQPLDAQQRALRAGPRRRVVLSTNVAETALTVEGVTTVIDSGLARVARLDARHGINTLRVVPISRASADQRTGRAGRTAPGRCMRLWTRADHAGRRAHETPEVLRLDLSRTVLELRGWGLGDARGLKWLDPPPDASLASAERLLVQLAAVDSESGALTETGRRMLELPVPPRIARLLVEAERCGIREDGALLAALATERDICLEHRAFAAGDASRWPAGPSDLLLRLDLFEDARRRRFEAAACRAMRLDPGTVRAAERTRRQLTRILARSSSPPPPLETRHRDAEREALLRCILVGFPDRVARRRAAGSAKALMVGGRGIVLSEHSVVRENDLFVAVDVDAAPGRRIPEARATLASAIRRTWLRDLFPGAVRELTEIVFDPERERVVERTRELFQDLVLAERVRLDVDPAQAGEVLGAAARQDPARAARLGEPERVLLARLRFLHRWMPELGLPENIDTLVADSIASLCAGRCSFHEIRRNEVASAVLRQLTSAQIGALDREAPLHFSLPGGRSAAVVYEQDKPAAVAARIQELFGLVRTPLLARGRVALVMEILAPNQRPVQITDDLESFWRNTYPEVRKQLRGRYPKHDWPEDPFSATPTSRPGRRRR